MRTPIAKIRGEGSQKFLFPVSGFRNLAYEFDEVLAQVATGEKEERGAVALNAEGKANMAFVHGPAGSKARDGEKCNDAFGAVGAWFAFDGDACDFLNKVKNQTD